MQATKAKHVLEGLFAIRRVKVRHKPAGNPNPEITSKETTKKQMIDAFRNCPTAGTGERINFDSTRHEIFCHRNTVLDEPPQEAVHLQQSQVQPRKKRSKVPPP
ncbi:hypothetical protein L2E82_19678 [Cichorium intybus]|uniref:Uncharacterized protein n=1 Tax=Cichorium intybus TaxID=13427 RepID=A0ACB9FCG2_CICIN|nr:hypothetical protein L2E82_19678 [Cichorium intybus]